MLITPDLQHRELIVEQVGPNPSAMNGVKLKKGEKRKAYQNDIIEVLATDHPFKVEFSSASRMDMNKDKADSPLYHVKNTSRSTGTLDSFFKNCALKPAGRWEMIVPDSLYIFSSDAIESREKVIVLIYFVLLLVSVIVIIFLLTDCCV